MLSDLISPLQDELYADLQFIDRDRIKRLLARGFQLSQAIERWQARSIWVVSRADSTYPSRLSARLKGDAPPILYGCGDAAILDGGGLAVVGSRNADESTLEYTEEVGELTAKARHTLISGGARGIDQAAMRGALVAGGKVAGVLADSLERAALNRENRNFLMEGELVLVSPYDPIAGFNVGHAMQRNKLIYALSDAALVVSSDYNKGGTWAGAIEQLDKLQFVPVYVRANTKSGIWAGRALQRRGAIPWPNPQTPDALRDLVTDSLSLGDAHQTQNELNLALRENAGPCGYEVGVNVSANKEKSATNGLLEPSSALGDELFAKVRDLLKTMKTPRTDAEIASDLDVSNIQAKKWLQRLVAEGVIEKYTNPVRFGPKSQRSLLE